jgi:cation diffusion facilitator family transporter
MIKNSLNSREQSILSVTLWGVVINVFLTALKIISGIFIRSSALIADGIHSFSDLSTDLVVLISVRLSSRPPDETHPFGHRKFDTIATQVIGLVLLVVGFGFVWTAGTSIYRGKVNYPGFLMLIVAGISVLAKEVIFYWTRKVSRITGCTSLYANAWHHRSDSLSSLAVLAGGIASLFGWGHADHVATVVVGFMIMGVAGKILYDGLIELTEHSADRESIQAIEGVLSREGEISGWHALRTRKVGGELFVDVHILVDPALSVQKSHEISVKLEEKVRTKLPHPVNILVHIEPDI